MYRLIKIMTLLILMAGWMAPVWAAPGSLNTWVQTSTNIQPGSNGNAFSFSPNWSKTGHRLQARSLFRY